MSTSKLTESIINDTKKTTQQLLELVKEQEQKQCNVQNNLNFVLLRLGSMLEILKTEPEIAKIYVDDIIRIIGDLITPNSVNKPIKTYLKPMEIIEWEHIEKALTIKKWNVVQTAKALGISRSSLKRKITKYELKRPKLNTSLPATHDVNIIQAIAKVRTTRTI